jgi:hypothetical protein
MPETKRRLTLDEQQVRRQMIDLVVEMEEQDMAKRTKEEQAWIDRNRQTNRQTNPQQLNQKTYQPGEPMLVMSQRLAWRLLPLLTLVTASLEGAEAEELAAFIQCVKDAGESKDTSTPTR